LGPCSLDAGARAAAGEARAGGRCRVEVEGRVAGELEKLPGRQGLKTSAE